MILNKENLMEKKQFEITDIIELKSVNLCEEVNLYLKVGWIIIAVNSYQYAENGYHSSYDIGWLGSKGRIVYPHIEDPLF
jgi:hypothetical protein